MYATEERHFGRAGIQNWMAGNNNNDNDDNEWWLHTANTRREWWHAAVSAYNLFLWRHRWYPLACYDYTCGMAIWDTGVWRDTGPRGSHTSSRVELGLVWMFERGPNGFYPTSIRTALIHQHPLFSCFLKHIWMDFKQMRIYLLICHILGVWNCSLQPTRFHVIHSLSLIPQPPLKSQNNLVKIRLTSYQHLCRI